MTVVEGFEQKVSSYLRRWLGLPRSLSNIALYGKTNKLRLPFGSVREEFIVARAREHLMYSGSRDAKVSGAGIVVRTGRKWRAAEAVQQAETRLKHKAILGSVTQGRAGLGSLTATRYDLASGRERQRLVQEEEQAMERNVTWKDIWTWNPQRIRFLIQGVYDILPSPSNLYTWGRVETPACPLCSKPGTLEHILSSCSKALGEGRYWWRHDQVLKSIAEAISKGIKDSRYRQATAKAIHFVKEGQRPEKTSKSCSAGLLSTARDWVMSVDLERQLKIPQHIIQSTLRPDIILVSEATRQLILLELTVPWEERI
ncbi:Spore protein YkvP [Labeo rohita]|uniref:Spore protein YkvP n=1 Tax=Labeo rohita TaxID=84645 RepID=A0ABQ8MFQ6_LABRO|nr:Spore protein YkvP [Labeo rohita]